MVIKFYRQNEDPYGCFSNFFKGFPIEVDKVEWPTVEHYFQAAKFRQHAEIQEKIRSAGWAGNIKAMVKANRHLVDNIRWNSCRDTVMLQGVRAKFFQRGELRELLLSTEQQELVEHTENDSYWADGGDGSGKNMLGKILMRVRDELRRSQGTIHCSFPIWRWPGDLCFYCDSCDTFFDSQCCPDVIADLDWMRKCPSCFGVSSAALDYLENWARLGLFQRVKYSESAQPGFLSQQRLRKIEDVSILWYSSEWFVAVIGSEDLGIMSLSGIPAAINGFSEITSLSIERLETLERLRGLSSFEDFQIDIEKPTGCREWTVHVRAEYTLHCPDAPFVDSHSVYEYRRLRGHLAVTFNPDMRSVVNTEWEDDLIDYFS